MSSNGGIFGALGKLNPFGKSATSPEVEAAEKEKVDLVAKQEQELKDADEKIQEARRKAAEPPPTTPNPDGVQGGKRKRKHTKRNHKKGSKKGRTGRKSSRL